MMYFELGKLTFNSQFWIEITRQAPGRRPKTERVEFSTPGCMKPDETFTQCLDTDTTKISEFNFPKSNHKCTGEIGTIERI